MQVILVSVPCFVGHSTKKFSKISFCQKKVIAHGGIFRIQIIELGSAFMTAEHFQAAKQTWKLVALFKASPAGPTADKLSVLFAQQAKKYYLFL